MKPPTTKVLNLGLPRTGTTTTTAALKRLGLVCTPVVAQRVRMDISGRLDMFEGFEPQEGPLLICTVRDLESWRASVQAWPPGQKLTTEYLDEVYNRHCAWLLDPARPWKVGAFSVTEGYSGLFGALSVCDWSLPLLNQRTS